LDPDYAMAYAGLARAYHNEVWMGFGKSPEESLRQELESIQKAISLNDSLPLAHFALAGFHLLKREHQKAISEAQKTISLNPNPDQPEPNRENSLSR